MSSTYDLILKGGILATADGIAPGDLAIKDGRIAAVGAVSGDAAETVDVTGLHIMPGVIDTQVHFREPGLEHKEDIESGTRSAVAGGVTTIFEMPNTKPTTTTPEALEDKLKRSEGRAWADHAYFMGASDENAERLGEYEMLPGTPGIKIFMGSSTGELLVESDESVRRVLQHGKRPCPVHSEDEARLRERKALLSAHPHWREHPILRDAEAARRCTERLIRLSEETGRPVHILHISTLNELALIQGAKAAHLPVTCEVTPQHLSLNADAYETLGSLVQMNPPVRAEEHRAAIEGALVSGVFDVIGSDHAPHTLEEKSKPYPDSPSGMPGVQTLLPLMLDKVNAGLISLEKLIKMTSRRPADLYGIKDKGELKEGYDADLAIVDLGRKWTIEKEWLQYKCGWSPFVGWEITGKPIHTLVRGQFALRDDRLVGNPLGQPVRFTWKD